VSEFYTTNAQLQQIKLGVPQTMLMAETSDVFLAGRSVKRLAEIVH
jgi:hypothetical protein